MRRVESSFLRRLLAYLGIAVITATLGGCIWDDGYRGHGWGWNDHDGHRGYDHDSGHHRHHDRDDDDDD